MPYSSDHQKRDGSRASGFERELKGYCLTTAHILYHMPDHPRFLQTYIWQNYDLVPDHPELRRFLDFWQRNLDGPLHSVRFATSGPLAPREIRAIDGVLHLH
jgi:uncharacterized protein Usg